MKEEDKYSLWVYLALTLIPSTYYGAYVLKVVYDWFLYAPPFPAISINQFIGVQLVLGYIILRNLFGIARPEESNQKILASLIVYRWVFPSLFLGTSYVLHWWFITR